MNKTDTKVWLDYHGSIFAEWKAWFNGMSKEARAIVFQSCAKALTTTELDDAREVTDRMLEGKVRRPFREADAVSLVVSGAAAIAAERTASKHAAAVPEYIDGQLVVKCLQCLDTGWVECWRADRVHKFDIVCSCRAGDRHTGRPWGSKDAKPDPNVPRFDPSRCTRVEPPAESIDYGTEAADRAQYLRERGAGLGLLNRLAMQLGLPRTERAFTQREILEQLSRIRRAETSPHRTAAT